MLAPTPTPLAISEADQLRLVTRLRNLPLFELSNELLGAMPDADAGRMFVDMEKVGILQLPYDTVAVRFWLPAMVDSFNVSNPEEVKQGYVTCIAHNPLNLVFDKDGRGNLASPCENIIYLEMLDGDFFFADVAKVQRHNTDIVGLDNACGQCVADLVTALASRNVVKVESRNNRIGTDKRPKAQFHGPQGTGITYISRTRLSAPPASELEDDPDHPPTGAAKRPHLRRGHAHTVAHGIGRKERRVQWYPAVFVNADPSYIPERKKYRML